MGYSLKNRADMVMSGCPYYSLNNEHLGHGHVRHVRPPLIFGSKTKGTCKKWTCGRIRTYERSKRAARALGPSWNLLEKGVGRGRAKSEFLRGKGVSVQRAFFGWSVWMRDLDGVTGTVLVLSV